MVGPRCARARGIGSAVRPTPPPKRCRPFGFSSRPTPRLPHPPSGSAADPPSTSDSRPRLARRLVPRLWTPDWAPPRPAPPAPRPRPRPQPKVLGGVSHVKSSLYTPRVNPGFIRFFTDLTRAHDALRAPYARVRSEKTDFTQRFTSLGCQGGGF